MTEHGILFTAPMVRALLAGTKTQTRRLMKPAPVHWPAPFPHGSWQWDGGQQLVRAGFGAAYVHTDAAAVADIAARFCPYGKPGDRLWVRETWAPVSMGGADIDTILYRATPGLVLFKDKDRKWICHNADPKLFTVDRWHPSIFMPRWASRITLELTGVRVERLQDISDEDAVHEGVERLVGEPGCCRWRHYGTKALHDEGYSAAWEFPSNSYASLWESINGPGSWDANPWVWCLSFRRIDG